MKIINSYFRDCEDTDNTFSNIKDEIIDFLKTIVDDEKLLDQIISNIDHSLIQLTDGEKYTILSSGGKLSVYRYPDSSSAFETNMAVNVREDSISIIPGVALRPNYNRHQLVHELLHVISTRQHNSFNEEGIACNKIGTRINFFDKNLDIHQVEYNPSSDGLNEGITELLTSKITNEYTGNYPGYLVVANILMSCNNQLLNAYFSNDLNKLESFYADLEEKQSVITREDLLKLDSNKLEDSELIKLIVGGIKYNDAYNNKIDIGAVSNYLDNYYMLDTGSWKDVISESLSKYEENSTISKSF